MKTWNPAQLQHPPLPPPETEFYSPKHMRDVQGTRHTGNGYTRDQSYVLRNVFASMSDLLVVATYLEGIGSPHCNIINDTPLPNMDWVSGLEDVMPHNSQKLKEALLQDSDGEYYSDDDTKILAEHESESLCRLRVALTSTL